MDTYQSGEIPEIYDIVRFNDSWLSWCLQGSQTMIVLRMGHFPSGRNYVVVGEFCKDEQPDPILTQWNPGSFIKIK